MRHTVLQILTGIRKFDLTNPTSCFVIFFSSFLPIQVAFLQDLASQQLPSFIKSPPNPLTLSDHSLSYNTYCLAHLAHSASSVDTTLTMCQAPWILTPPNSPVRLALLLSPFQDDETKAR